MPTQPRTLYSLLVNRKVLLVSIIVTLLTSIFLPRLSLSLRTSSASLQIRGLKASIAHNTYSTRSKQYTSMAYEEEQKVAIAAVLKACDVAQATFQKLVNDETVTKKDKSPVTGEWNASQEKYPRKLHIRTDSNSSPTVADYAAQALVSTLIGKSFPDYPLIGEEDATDLKTEEQASVREKIVELANKALSENSGTSQDQAVWNIVGKEPLPTETWLDAIDRGNAKYSNKGRKYNQTSPQ